MLDLAHVQSTFAQALLDSSAAVPPAVRGAARRKAERRFAVYRNNVLTGLVSALAARFPVVQRLVGDEFFREMARVYVAQEPPNGPILMQYGETFAAFIDGFAAAAPVPYLGDVARLEMARGRAYHAADVVPLAAQTFTTVRADRLASTRVNVPSIRSGTPTRTWIAMSRSFHGAPNRPWWRVPTWTSRCTSRLPAAACS